MKSSFIHSLRLFLLLLTLVACSPSLTYSPSYNLSHGALEKDQVDLSGGIELLPETRPEKVNGVSTSLGYNLRVAYGFRENFNMNVKAWGDIRGPFSSSRGGYALSAQFIKELADNKRLLFIPRAGIATGGFNVDGFGIGFSTLRQHDLNERFSWYTGGGLIWGFNELESTENYLGQNEFPMGYALKANLGLAYQLGNHLRLNAELNPIFQLNPFDAVNHFIIAPSLNLGYTF